MKYPIIITIIIISFFSACNSSKKEITTETQAAADSSITLTEAQFKNAQITTINPEKKNISSVLKVNGKIDVPPQNLVSISMPLGGYLKTTHLLPGMPVKKGEVLAVLEDQQYIQLQEDYLTAKTKLVFAEKEATRQKELNLTKASSDKVYQTAEMEYKTLQINLSALAEKLKLININPTSVSPTNISRSVSIYSPISGFVSKVNVNIGKYISPQDVMFELINTSDIHLNLTIFEKDIEKIKIGQKLIAYSNANPTIKYPCEIILISRDVTNDGSVEVHCHFEKYDHSLFPGMYMNAEIEIKNQASFVIPDDAIVSFEGKQYVFIDKGNRQYALTETEIGVGENGMTAINIHGQDNLQTLNMVQKGAYTLLMQLKNKPEE
jgi:cobalt-zinc-cadmium efflux system membrane fusion protein